MTYTQPQGYREMEILSMTPAQRVVALYARLHVLLLQARNQLDVGDIAAREERLMAASAIVHELAVSLDRERGGQLADQLAALYTWLIGEFTAIHAKADRGRLEATINIVRELHEAWQGAALQVSTPAASW
jgi:flagellar protein FliS